MVAKGLYLLSHLAGKKVQFIIVVVVVFVGPAQFFAPLKPVRITMEYSSSGKATGEADVHFKTHEDAVAAMLKDRSHVREYDALFSCQVPRSFPLANSIPLVLLN